MKILRIPVWLTASVLMTLACNDGHTSQSQTQIVRVPGDGSFRYAIADMVDRVGGGVVSITVTKESTAPQMMDPFEFFFGPGFGPPGMQRGPGRKQVETGLGSGVIVSPSGYILTNNHVIEGATKIEVQLSDERKFKAKIIGTDEATDLAVIQIDQKFDKLPVVDFANSDSVRVGEFVVAIGNPFGLSHTVTTGIISAKGVYGRGLSKYENFLQTDAAINPGNSGGALLNLDGRLIGINAAILSRSGGNQGIGFAIPVNMAKRVLDDLINKGTVQRGWLGVGIQDLDAEVAKAMKLEGQTGALLTEVMPGTPAEKAGLQVGDLITAIDGEKLKNSNELRNKVAMIAPGTSIKVDFIREGKAQSANLKIAPREDEKKVAEKSDTTKVGNLGLTVAALDAGWRQRLNLNPNQNGVVVQRVADKSVAAEAGIEPGDVVLRVGSVSVNTLDDYERGIKALQKQKSGVFLILRKGARVFVGVEF